ncbi:MAG: hypothetical protein U0798_03800 [Gemmataceae bacterium]
MNANSRREFLADVGRGMLVAGLGSGLAYDLGLASASAEEPAARLNFGSLEPLVSLMQETPIDQLMSRLVEKLQSGTELRTLVAAGALANARTFGGQDYTGYHAFMALPPALDMTKELPEKQRALPVLKVLYRNSARIQEHGGVSSEILHPLTEHDHDFTAETLCNAVHKRDMNKAEQTFASMPADAYDKLLQAVMEEVDVHRVVLAWRAWSMIDIAGKEYAHTLLRQSVRYCVDSEMRRKTPSWSASEITKLLPKLLDEHKLIAIGTGTKAADDQWVKRLADTIYGESRARAAEAVAMALAEGFDPEAVGEAMSLAATRLVLRDPGRAKAEAGKPVGSIHGASVGVHASDSANAWRNISRVSSPRNRIASLIVGAYHTAGQATGQSDRPRNEKADAVDVKDPASFCRELDRAVKANDQSLAVSLVERYTLAGHDVKPVFNTLLAYACSEDGALHAEKYYRTIREEYAKTRASFRAQHLAALARVTASEHGFAAAGYAEACKLLKA